MADVLLLQSRPPVALGALRCLGRASRRFDRELDELRTLARSFDGRVFRRLRDTQWMPLDAVSRLVDEISAAPRSSEHRAIGLAAELDTSIREVDAVCAQGQAAIAAAHQPAQS